MQISDRATLEDLLLDVNYEHGETPELAGYDKAGRPVVAWLFDGGDDAPMRTTILGGEDAGRPELIDVDPDALLYPLTVLIPESWTWLATTGGTNE